MISSRSCTASSHVGNLPSRELSETQHHGVVLDVASWKWDDRCDGVGQGELLVQDLAGEGVGAAAEGGLVLAVDAPLHRVAVRR